MTTNTGTYNFAPYSGELTLEVFERIGWRNASLTPEMLVSALRSFNLVQSAWTNLGVNLWAIDQQTLPLIQGTATYTLSAPLIDVLPEGVLSISVGGQPTNRVLFPLSREEYTAIANPTTQGPPTSFWVNRQQTPTITFWPVPDGNGPYSFIYWRFRQQQDAQLGGAINPEIPYRFYEAYCAAVAAHLSMKWQPQRTQMLMAYADKMWRQASDADREKVAFRIAPNLDGYFS